MEKDDNEYHCVAEANCSGKDCNLIHKPFFSGFFPRKREAIIILECYSLNTYEALVSGVGCGGQQRCILQILLQSDSWRCRRQPTPGSTCRDFFCFRKPPFTSSCPFWDGTHLILNQCGVPKAWISLAKLREPWKPIVVPELSLVVGCDCCWAYIAV